MRMGYSKEQVLAAFTEVSESSQKKEISSLWPAVLCRLQEDQVYGLHSESKIVREGCHATSDFYTNPNGNKLMFFF
jgi:crossover junction endonuclease MUS81